MGIVAGAEGQAAKAQADKAQAVTLRAAAVEAAARATESHRAASLAAADMAAYRMKTFYILRCPQWRRRRRFRTASHRRWRASIVARMGAMRKAKEEKWDANHGPLREYLDVRQ